MTCRPLRLAALPMAALLVFAGPPPRPALAQEQPAAETAEGLLTSAELQTLVAPVALYPDTLLIQILVGATAPLDVVKADRLLTRDDGLDADALEAAIRAEGFDPSVEVLALAFPTVVSQMAEHVEWTETVGTAMLAQSDDVLDAVQVMRDVAIDTGALLDTEEQLVTRDAATDAVIIQPADPQVVYVPQYDPQVVYATQPTNVVGDAILTGAITFGTIALIDEIFDDDDDWDDYWGCRNCGGWDGGPIIRDPDIDIDMNGDVNIGNRLDIQGGDRLDIDRDNLAIDRDQIGWRPDPAQSGEARERIEARRDGSGATTLPIERPATDADALRDRLSRETGAADIARDRDVERVRETVRTERPQVDRPPVNRPAARDGAAVANGKDLLRERNPSAGTVRRPSSTERPDFSSIQSHARSTSRDVPQIARHGSGNRAAAASRRGNAAGHRSRRN